MAKTYLALPKHWRERQPVSPGTYRLFRRLQYEGPLALEAIEPELPPRRAVGDGEA